MSWVARTPHRALHRLHDLVEGPLDDHVTFGAEDERFYVATDGSIARPKHTQHFLEARIAAGGVGDFDFGEHGTALGRVVEERVTWSLEAAGVVELSTRPYRLTELSRFGLELERMLAIRDRDMRRLGLLPCDFSAPRTLRTEVAARRLAPISRLRSLHTKFSAAGPDHPGHFTMFQEAVAQISFAPTSLREAAVLARRAIQWAPLFYAATDNSTGMLRGKPVGHCIRSREWARHNAFSPPGCERAGVPPVLLDLAFGAPEEGFVERYLDHVERVPLLFWYRDGELRMDEEPDFRTLAARGEGTVENAALSLSFAWFDARLSPIVTKTKRWMRVELRSFDGGWSGATWLAALLACGALSEEGGGRAADELFASAKISREEYMKARASLPLYGLDTPFGRTTLRELLRPFCAIAIEHCEKLGVRREAMAALVDLGEHAESRSEYHRRGIRVPDRGRIAS